MKPPKKFNISAGTYDFTIRCIITKDFEYVRHYINRNQARKGKDEATLEPIKRCFGRYYPHPQYYPILFMPVVPKTARQIATAAHEILHAVFDCLNWYGVDYTIESQEAFNHLHTHLFTQFLLKSGALK